jgi:hypothetical protein
MALVKDAVPFINFINALMQSFKNALAYYATTICYTDEMFMKWTPVVDFIKHFLHVTYGSSKIGRTIHCMYDLT